MTSFADMKALLRLGDPTARGLEIEAFFEAIEEIVAKYFPEHDFYMSLAHESSPHMAFLTNVEDEEKLLAMLTLASLTIIKKMEEKA